MQLIDDIAAWFETDDDDHDYARELLANAEDELRNQHTMLNDALETVDLLRAQLQTARDLLRPMVEAARRATPGPWAWERGGQHRLRSVRPDSRDVVTVIWPEVETMMVTLADNTRHIETAHPAAILALAAALGMEVGDV